MSHDATRRLITVRPWSLDDAAHLRPLVQAFLEACWDRGGDMEPEPATVDYWLGQGLAHAQRGDPTLLAAVPKPGEPDLIVGYVHIALASFPYKVRYRTAFAIGSYVVPAVRRHGIAAILREEAVRIGDALGIQKYSGPVQLTNPRGVQAFIEEWQAWPTAVTMELVR